MKRFHVDTKVDTIDESIPNFYENVCRTKMQSNITGKYRRPFYRFLLIIFQVLCLFNSVFVEKFVCIRQLLLLLLLPLLLHLWSVYTVTFYADVTKNGFLLRWDDGTMHISHSQYVSICNACTSPHNSC